MTESHDRSIVEAVKADVAETLLLYFAPIRAVVREFNRAISSSAEDTKPQSHPKVPA